jgi:signal transduction histidine kinase
VAEPAADGVKVTSILPPRTIEHERRRLAALHEYRLLDAPADDELEAAVRVAASVAGVPTATLNLIDEQRQCQLTTVGFEGADPARSDSMTITVTDSGIGIPAEQYPQLFTRFFRADTATSRGIKGTGLSLTIAKAIVEAHHGTITACPAAGGGTSFTLALPTE